MDTIHILQYRSALVAVFLLLFLFLLTFSDFFTLKADNHKDFYSSPSTIPPPSSSHSLPTSSILSPPQLSPLSPLPPSPPTPLQNSSLSALSPPLPSHPATLAPLPVTLSSPIFASDDPTATLIKQRFVDDAREASGRENVSDKCNLYSGRWVYDETYPLWDFSECPFHEDSFDCQANGRKDVEYMKLRWQPTKCNIPRFNASDFRRRMFGKRFAFVGDSLGRTQFMSLLCIISQGINTSRIHDTKGSNLRVQHDDIERKYFFEEFNFTMELLIQVYFVENIPAPKGSPKNVASLLLVDRLNDTWTSWVKGADYVVLNFGHWLSREKTYKIGKYYGVAGAYQAMDMPHAFKHMINAVTLWADGFHNNVFFRGYSPHHTEGHHCSGKFHPPHSIEKYYAHFTKSTVAAIRRMQHPVTFLNILPLSAQRGEAHVGKMLRKNMNDCSHWCVPGVPDIWNELLYAHILTLNTSSKS